MSDIKLLNNLLYYCSRADWSFEIEPFPKRVRITLGPGRSDSRSDSRWVVVGNDLSEALFSAVEYCKRSIYNT